MCDSEERGVVPGHVYSHDGGCWCDECKNYTIMNDGVCSTCGSSKCIAIDETIFEISKSFYALGLDPVFTCSGHYYDMSGYIVLSLEKYPKNDWDVIDKVLRDLASKSSVIFEVDDIEYTLNLFLDSREKDDKNTTIRYYVEDEFGNHIESSGKYSKFKNWIVNQQASLAWRASLSSILSSLPNALDYRLKFLRKD